MDPFSIGSMGPISGGSGGFKGGSSSSALNANDAATFGDYGAASYNFGSGSASATDGGKPNWYLIAGLAVAALVAIKLLRK